MILQLESSGTCNYCLWQSALNQDTTLYCNACYPPRLAYHHSVLRFAYLSGILQITFQFIPYNADTAICLTDMQGD